MKPIAFISAAVLLLSLVWVFWLDTYQPPLAWIGWVLVVVAVVLAGIGSRHETERSVAPWFAGLVVLAGIFGTVVWRLPHGVGWGLLACGTLLYVLLPSRLRFAGIGVALAGGIAATHSMAWLAVSPLMARQVHVPLLAPIIAPLLRLFGVEAAVRDGAVLLRTFESVLTLTPSLDAFGVVLALPSQVQ